MRFLTTQDGLPRVSWGAVIAGVILSLIVYLVLSVLGTAVGASLLSPLSRPNPLQGFGFASGVWIIVTTVIAVFAGSYFAGRCAPVLGWLHGLLAWAVMILVVAYGMTSIIGGAVSVAGNVASAGATVGATANSQPGGGTVANSIAQQVQGVIAPAASEASSPTAAADARQAGDTAARDVARASWFSFAALIVGAIIALGSGSLGFRHQPPFEEGGGAALDDAPLNETAPRVTRPSRPVR
ncbi:YrzE family protein [Paraburkholderia sp.]|uniref:YrzE family protein n=1 Tax=Paraburkholderia sp. TaxID=1926495 RepID=UPI002D6ACF38|nr:YrzE family protein [Paraburkholderia sp.]HZZ02336.1 YrzE family protein [Paraburkholderia sp.]